MKNIYSVFLLLGLSAAPLISQAGAGHYITIRNGLPASAPRTHITIHNNNGSTCWDDYGLSDWAQYAGPGQTVTIYAEATFDIGGCDSPFGSTIPRVRGVGLFAGATGVPWAPIWKGRAAPNDFKITHTGSSSTPGYFEESPPVYQDLGYGICVLDYKGRNGNTINRTSSGTIIFDSDGYTATTFYVTVTVGLCSNRAASAAYSNIPVANDASVAPPPDSIPAPTNSYVNPKPIHVKVGQTVNVTVPIKHLSSDTEWDLGGCSTPGATQVIQHRHSSKGKRLADSLEITGVSPGSLTCALNANDYDESGHVWPLVQQVFNVVVR